MSGRWLSLVLAFVFALNAMVATGLLSTIDAVAAGLFAVVAVTDGDDDDDDEGECDEDEDEEDAFDDDGRVTA